MMQFALLHLCIRVYDLQVYSVSDVTEPLLLENFGIYGLSSYMLILPIQ
jgi:hypothetical protein